jgi:MFS family permease
MTARFVQGMSSSISWTGGIGWILAAAPRERRGELLGVALGSGIFGAVFGPVLGSLAAITSRGIVFTGFAVVAAATALWAMRIHDAHEHAPSPGSIRRAAANPTFLAGLGLMLLPAFLLGVVLVLGPLHLSDRGWGAAAVGAVWLVNAVLQASLSAVLGRMSDRRGPAVPTAALLGTGAALAVALTLAGAPLVYAIVLVSLSTAYGGLYAPAFAMIAHGAEDSGLAQGLAFAAMNAAWSVGAVIGPATGGSVAEAAGDRVPLLVCAGVCLAALAFTVTRLRRPVTAPAG